MCTREADYGTKRVYNDKFCRPQELHVREAVWVCNMRDESRWLAGEIWA